MPRLEWANGGMSSAAGHGNLYNESYTAVFERAVQPTLQGLGVWFETRNYAVSVGLSAPEMALCSLPIYGSNVDAIVWNYAQTEGRDVASMEMFLRQVSMALGRPSCVALDVSQSRQAILHHLENSGVAAFTCLPTCYWPPKMASRNLWGSTMPNFNRCPLS
jgi:hypothetical protein